MKPCNKIYSLIDKKTKKVIYALDSNMDLELKITEHKEV